MTPLVDVTGVVALPEYRLFVTFEDGKQGIYDVCPHLEHGVFQRLKDKNLFARASVDYGTVVWPGDLDIAPETLWEECVPAAMLPDGRVVARYARDGGPGGTRLPCRRRRRTRRSWVYHGASTSGTWPGWRTWETSTRSWTTRRSTLRT